MSRQLLNASEDVEGERGPQRLTVDLADPETDRGGRRGRRPGAPT